MPRQVTVLQVLIASPNDVAEERHIARQVVDEVNALWAPQAGLQLEAITWETHARPGIGADPQDVINAQLPDDYDILVGILWSRFGTPTPRAESGTEEEFMRAYKRNRDGGGRPSVLMYFKTSPVDMATLDLAQVQRVRDFKAGLTAKGVLYKEFGSGDQLRSQLIAHLIAELRAWAQPAQVDEGSVEDAGWSVERQTIATLTDDPDIGFVDLVELSLERIRDAVAGAQRLSEATQRLGEATQARTAQLGELQVGTPKPGDVAAARRVFKRISEDMDEYANIAEAEIPSLVARTLETIQTYNTLAAFARDIGPEAEVGSREGARALGELRSTLLGVFVGVDRFRASIARLPRAQRDFNVARRRVVQVLDKLLGGLEESVALLNGMLGDRASSADEMNEA